MSEGGGFNLGFIGQDFRWWLGQVADDSYWRDNIVPGKFKSPETIRGWAYRYKVRIFGLHDLGEEVIKSENLPWAQVMYPTTAGAYLQNSGQTPMIRQGNIVFGFFLDGVNEEQPVIMGVLGNNSQTELATTIGDNRVTNTTSGKSVCVSGYSEGNEDYDGNAKPTPPDGDKKVTKPIDKEIAEESSKPATGVALNQYGLPINRDLNQFQQADINSARAEAETKNLSPEESTKLIRKRVQKGISDRSKEANSPRSDVKPGATIESEATMIQTVSDLKRDRVYCEKRVLLKPDNLVESTNKAMQTDMDNLVQNIDKAMNALQSYTDAVSITQEQQNLEKMIADSSKRQSKYMKPVMDKMMEYSQKSINKEMTKAVSALPAYKRMEFLDVKDGIGQNLLSSYLGMTNGNAGLIEGIIRKTLKLDEMIDQFANAAVNDTSSDGETKKPKGMPRVPICKSEDVISTVLAVNKSLIDQTNNNLIGGIDGFLMDAIGDVADVSGGVTSIFSKLGNIKGSLTSALNFENIKMNVFPFEKTPNPAVSDYYTLCDGGGAQSQSALPSPMGMEKAASKHINKISQLAEGQSYVETRSQVAFGEPDKATADVDLTEGGVQTEEDYDPNDDE
jgi:hypothetical protein